MLEVGYLDSIIELLPGLRFCLSDNLLINLHNLINVE
jgi:hypothetical protein